MVCCTSSQNMLPASVATKRVTSHTDIRVSEDFVAFPLRPLVWDVWERAHFPIAFSFLAFEGPFWTAICIPPPVTDHGSDPDILPDSRSKCSGHQSPTKTLNHVLQFGNNKLSRNKTMSMLMTLWLRDWGKELIHTIHFETSVFRSFVLKVIFYKKEFDHKSTQSTFLYYFSIFYAWFENTYDLYSIKCFFS